MTRRYRLLGIDLDGTLLNSSNGVPAANRDALHRAHEAGLVLCLCTGRSMTETRPVIAEIGLDLDVAVCVFGALVGDARTGATRQRFCIPRRTTGRLIEFFTSQGYPTLVLQDPQECGVDYYLIGGVADAAAYEQWLRLSPTQTRRVDAWPDDAPEPLRVGVIGDPDAIVGLAGAMASTFSPSEVKCNTIFAPNYRLHVLECFAPQVNKWFGISQVAGAYGIDASQIAAVGDDVNDIEMIRHAGLGVAMGNAIPAVHSLARVRTTTNDEAGVAAFIERLLGGEFEGEEY